jgi:hypothetical protein
MNPQSNGQSERININIKKSLSIFARDTAQWDEHVHFYELLYNSAIHKSTNEKPAYLHLSYDPMLPTDILNDTQVFTPNSYPDYVATKTSQFQNAFRQVRKLLETAAENQENYENKNAKYRNFQVGQLVYLYNTDTDRRMNLPKRRNFIGPMRIIEQHNKVNFTILDAYNPRAKPTKVHARRLIPITQRRPSLDYLQTTAQGPLANHSQFAPPSTSAPPAVFDDLEDEQMAAIAACSDLFPVDTQPRQNDLPSSSADNGTLLPQATKQPTHSYDLRPRSTAVNNLPIQNAASDTQNLADRFINWGLRLTEPGENESFTFPLLNKIADALN